MGKSKVEEGALGISSFGACDGVPLAFACAETIQSSQLRIAETGGRVRFRSLVVATTLLVFLLHAAVLGQEGFRSDTTSR
jgi:hypothetical protein